MALSYDGKLLIPAPLVTINKTYNTTNDGTQLSASYDITLNGTLLPNRGSPSSGGIFSTSGIPADQDITTQDDQFKSILHKQQAIKNLFASDGLVLEWLPPAQSPVQAYPSIVEVSFPEGTWTDRSIYSIKMKANRLFGPLGVLDESFGEFNEFNLQEASDSWSLKESDDGTNIITLSHNVAAKAAQIFVGEGYDNVPTSTGVWILAKQWVETRISSSDNVIGADGEEFLENQSIFALDFDNNLWEAYTRVRSEQIDRVNGSYAVTEDWILSSGVGAVIDLYTVKQDSDTANPAHADVLGVTNIFTIGGEVRGLENDKTKYANALAYFNDEVKGSLVGRINNVFNSSIPSLNTRPLTSVVTRDLKNGVIQYSFTFNNLPIVNIGNVLRYDISASQQGGANDTPTITQLAIIPIPGRAAGPIIQNMSTRPVVTRTIVGTLFLDDNSGTGWKFDADLDIMRGKFLTLINNEDLIPGTGFDDSFISSFSENFDPRNAIYSANIVYTLKLT